jgi:hypothetical protein
LQNIRFCIQLIFEISFEVNPWERLDQKMNVIALILFIIILAAIGIFLFGEYHKISADASITNGARKIVSEGMISEYENTLCWITGMLKSENGIGLVISHGAEKPCVYYSYISEHGIESSDDDSMDWIVTESKSEFADIPLLVQSRKYALQKGNILVEGGLLETINKYASSKVIDGELYRNSEYIIPDSSTVHVLGIPVKDAIKASNNVLLVTMKPIDEFINEKRLYSALFLIFSLVSFAAAVALIATFVWKLIKE